MTKSMLVVQSCCIASIYGQFEVMLPKNFKLISLVLGASLLAASVWHLVAHFDWRESLSALLGTDFLKLTILVWLTQFGYIVLRTCRWRMAVRSANPAVSFFDLYWITAVVVSLAILTPGQVGEALKIELLKRRGLLGRLPGLGAFALERILDVLVIAGMGVVGLLFGSGLAKRYPAMWVAAAVLICVGLGLLFFLLHFNPKGTASQWLAQMRSGSGSPKTQLKMVVITLLCWAFTGLGWQLSLSAVDVHLSLPEILWLVSLVTLGSVASLVPGGLGVAEVLTVEALTALGISNIDAQAGALILRAYGLIVIGFGLLHLLPFSFYRFSTRERLHDSPNQG